MKKTTYIALIAALTVAAAPLAANARPHGRSTAGAVIAGLAVGMGIGILSATASQSTQVYTYEAAPVVVAQPAPVVYQQPAPVVYQQPQVIYQQPQVIYQRVPQVIYTPPTRTVIYREPVRYPSYRHQHYYHQRNQHKKHYAPPPRRSSHRGTRSAPQYGSSPSSHRGTQVAPSPPPPRGNGLRRR